MADEKQEQTPVETEQPGSSTPENPYASTGAAPVSDDKSGVEAVEGAETEAKDVPLEETPEFQTAVEKAAQSKKDKELKPVYEEKKKLETEVTGLKQAIADKEREMQARVQMAAEIANFEQMGIDDKKLRSFEQAQQDTYVEHLYHVKNKPVYVTGSNMDATLNAFKNAVGEANYEKVTLADFVEVLSNFSELDDIDPASMKAKQVLSKMQERDLRAKFKTLLEKPEDKPAQKTAKAAGKPSSSTSTTPGGTRSFTRAQVADREFYKAHQKEIDEAAAKGLIK
jgi:hypothetical protein